MTRSEANRLSYLSLKEGLGNFQKLFSCHFESITFQKWGDQKKAKERTCSLIYIIEGEGVLSFDKGKEVFVGPGDVIQKIPGRGATLSYAGKGGEQAVLTIPEIFYNLYERNPHDGSDQSVFHIGLYADLVVKFQKLGQEIEQWATTRIFKVIEKSIKLIAEIQATNLMVNVQSEEESFWVTVRQDLCRELQNRFSLPDFAEKFSMSYSSFRQGFTKHVGMPPGVFHIHQRIEQVKMLLASSQMSLKEIANRFNYPDLPSFSKQFKKITGQTPGQYMKYFKGPQLGESV